MLNYGYYSVAAATIDVQIGDVEANTEAILKKAKECREQTDLLVFPELCISGYTCGDLFFESALLDACEAALERLCRELPGERMVIVGVPLRQTDRLYNCAAVLFQGKIIGIQVKSYIPNYNEFYEKRWFSDSFDLPQETIVLQGETIPFTSHLLIRDQTTKAVIGIDVCEDLWVPIPPSSLHALAGANVIVNLSASNETIGKRSTAVRWSSLRAQNVTAAMCTAVPISRRAPVTWYSAVIGSSRITAC
ncbi:MAG: nitrilase-related carbon-nitrogen hydrolase [Merdibacter sp.]